MINVKDKSCRENQNTPFMFSNFFFEYHAVYEIMWNIIVESDRPQMTIWLMRIARWIPKATNIHWECAMITAISRRWLYGGASVLRYSCIDCIVNPLNPELNPICYLLALLAHYFLHVSRIRVKSVTLRLLMSYIYIYIYIWSAYSWCF